MFRLQHLPAEMISPDRVAGSLKRLGSVIATVAAIGLATGAAFVALLWLDNSMRFLTPAVIRLGEAGPAAAAPSAADAIASPLAGQTAAAEQDRHTALDEIVPARSVSAISGPSAQRVRREE